MTGLFIARTVSMIKIKRAYDPAEKSDGRRFLVERLWPRGVKKKDLAYEAWLKDVAPSTELRKWFGHRVERWDEFRRRYRQELRDNPSAWQPLVAAGRRGTVTLIYSARDTEHNGAIVLQEFLTSRSRRRVAKRRASAAGRTPARRRAGVGQKRARS